jgi:hypothetical protein
MQVTQHSIRKITFIVVYLLAMATYLLVVGHTYRAEWLASYVNLKPQQSSSPAMPTTRMILASISSVRRVCNQALNGRAGTPTTVVPGATSEVTTAPAPTVAPFPTRKYCST